MYDILISIVLQYVFCFYINSYDNSYASFNNAWQFNTLVFIKIKV